MDWYEIDVPIEPEEMGKGCRDAIPTPDEPATMEIVYHVTGERRKKLVKVLSQITDMAATYQNTPSFAIAIGNYIVDKNGTLTGESSDALVGALEEQRFIAE